MTPFALLETGLQKKAADDAEADDHKKDRDRETIMANRRLKLLALTRALQFGALGAVGGGIVGAGADEAGLGALLGGAGGAVLGGGIGYGTGKVKQYFGMDPMLETTAITRST